MKKILLILVALVGFGTYYANASLNEINDAICLNNSISNDCDPDSNPGGLSGTYINGNSSYTFISIIGSCTFFINNSSRVGVFCMDGNTITIKWTTYDNNGNSSTWYERDTISDDYKTLTVGTVKYTSNE